MRMPGTLVAIGLNSPRMPSGAWGFRSKVSCCEGPPHMNSWMQLLCRFRETAARTRWLRSPGKVKTKKAEAANSQELPAGQPIAECRALGKQVEHGNDFSRFGAKAAPKCVCERTVDTPSVSHPSKKGDGVRGSFGGLTRRRETFFVRHPPHHPSAKGG